MMQNVYKNLNAFFFRLPLLWFLGLSYFTFTPLFAQSVSPDGSLQYDVAIEVPKGAGPTPPLRISYNSNSRNGMLGVGFRLEGLPVITRGNFGKGIKYDGNDTYFGPGGRLILQGSASAQPRVYLPQNYNGSRYLAYGSCGDGPCYWVEESGGGAKQYFGTSDIAGSNEQGRAIAVANPAGQAGSVREWALGRVEDSQGRYFEVEWETDGSQLYPIQITYTKGPGLTQYHTVTFDYEKGVRPDKELSYAQSTPVKTNWRLSSITVESEEPFLWGLFSWSNTTAIYEVAYIIADYSSLISTITKNGKSTTFSWQSGSPQFGLTLEVDGPTRANNNVRYIIGDFIGKGGQYVLQLLSPNDDTWVLGKALWNRWISQFQFASEQNITFDYLVGDVDGNGRTDIIQLKRNSPGIKIFKGQIIEYAMSWGTTTNFRPTDTHKYIPGDFNGDGTTDLFEIKKKSVRGEARFFSSINGEYSDAFDLPDHTYDKASDGYRYYRDWIGTTNFNDYYTGDFNGDGKMDFIEIGKNAGSTWPTARLFQSTEAFPFFVQSSVWNIRPTNDYIHIILDANGDGKSDILEVRKTNNWGSLKLSNGNTFGAVNSDIDDMVLAANNFNYYPAELNGDGKTDLIILSKINSSMRILIATGDGYKISYNTGYLSFLEPGNTHYHFVIDYDGDGIHEILQISKQSDRARLFTVANQTRKYVKSIVSHTNLRVDLAFRHRNDLQSISCSEGLPTGYGQPCGISMNSPRQLVSNIKTYAPFGVGGSDQLVSDTSYSYENSRFFPGTVQQRASLGFGKITQTDNLRNRRVETTYRQDRRYAGLPLEQKSYIGSDLVSHTTHDAPKQFRCDDSGCVEDNTLVLLEPRQVRQGKITTIEYDGIAQITKSQEVISYDSYGNPTESLESIAANGSMNAIRQYAEYINAPSATSIRRMGLPYYQKKCLGSCSATDIIEESYIYFDNQPAGQLGIEGQVTRRESHKVGVVLTENLTYNSYGQLVQKVNDAGITEAFEYDSFGHLSKTTVTSGSKSIVREQKIDPRYGVKVWAKDENDIIAKNDLDDRGRIVESRMTYNGDLMQKATASYQTDTAPFRATKCKYFGDGLAYSSCETVISDALGRKIYEITPSPQDVPGVLVAVKTEYDSLGRAYRVSEPYISDINGGGTPQRWNSNTFDNRDRVVSVTSVDGKSSSTVYNPALVSGSVSSQEITGPDGSVKRTYVDLSGQPMLIQEAFGTPQYAELKYTYDKFDRLIKVEAPQGITEIEYDALGRQKLVKDPHAGMTEYTYIDDITSPAYGSLLTEKRPAPNAAAGSSDTVTVSFEYNDPWGRLTKSTASDGTTTTYAYDESDMSFSENKLTTLSHTSNYFTVTDRFAYDVYGEVKTSSRRFAHASWNLCEDADALPCFSVVSSETDSLGRVTSFNYPDGTTGDFTYLREFSLPTAMKHEGNTMASWSGYDYRGQTGKVEYANGIETTWNYRADNGLLTNTKTATTGSTPQTLLHQEYSFDNALNITGIQDHIIDDYSVTFTYDKHNRLQTATRNGEVRDYKFDDQTKGNLLERRNLKLVYDTGAIRPQSTQIRDHSTAPWVNSESFEWSSGGNLRFRNHPNNSWEYSYDVDNMMKKAVDAAGNETLFFYDASGQRFLKVYKAVDKEEIRTWYLSDGYELREKFTPDGDEKLSDQATRYFYGPDGKRLASQTGEVTISQASLHYVYAGMFSGTVVGLVKKAYYYAKGGIHDPTVRQSFLVLFAALLVLYLSYYLYCRWEGNTSDRKQSVYVKQIALVLTGLILNFTVTSCMGEGRISISEKKNYDLSFDSLYGGLPVGTYYYTHDHLGSGSLITDDSGNEHLRIVYDEYGNIDQHRSGKFNPETNTISDAAADADKLLLAVKFTGQEYDPETGLYYYNARYYDPALGLFTTPDIYVDGADTTAGYNRYSYVQGNPVKYSDPSGHFISAVITAIVAVAKAVAVGAATGAGISYVASSASTGNWNLDSKKLNVVAQGALIGAASSIGALAGVSASSGIISEGGRVFIENVVGRAVGGALAGGVKASMSGQNFFEGAIKGYAHGALTGLLNGASLGLGDLGMGMSGSMIKDGLANMGSNAVARSMGMSNQSHGMAFGMGFLKGGMRHIVRHISKKYSGAEFEKSKYSTVGNGHTNTDIWDDLAKKYRNGDGSAKYGLLYRFDIKGGMDLSIWDEETAFTRALGLSLNSTSQIHDGINGYLRFINNYREISGFTNVSTMLPSLVAAQQLDRNSFWSYYK